MNVRFDNAYMKFTAALARFEEVLLEPRENSYLVDAAIQRFEFTIEMAWKVSAVFAQAQGLPAASPRQAMESAFKLGLVEDSGVWTAMLKDRNLSSHTYKQDLAEELYARLPDHLVHFKALAEKLAPGLAEPGP